MIKLSGSINSLTDEFRDRVEDLLENTEGIQSTTTETLARWISEEFSKFLVEKDDPEPEQEWDEDWQESPDDPWPPEPAHWKE